MGELVEKVARQHGISCMTPGCLASVYWFGHDADPALVTFAKAQGWALFEGAGWTCPGHLAIQRLGER